MFGRVSQLYYNIPSPGFILLLLGKPLVLDANDFCHRTMIWAIDLDDGSLLGALTSVSTKKKEEVLPELDFDTPDFGTTWDFIPEAKDKHKRDEL